MGRARATIKCPKSKCQGVHSKSLPTKGDSGGNRLNKKTQTSKTNWREIRTNCMLLVRVLAKLKDVHRLIVRGRW